MTTIAIPDRLQARPVYRGYVVPWVSAYIDGRPKFGANNEEKRRLCLAEHRCGQCGQNIEDELIAFIGGTYDLRDRYFSEPGMHEDCARYALAVCPYLANADYGPGHELVSTSTIIVEMPGLDQPATARSGKPMYLYLTDGFEIVGRLGSPWAYANIAHRIEAFRARPATRASSTSP